MSKKEIIISQGDILRIDTKYVSSGHKETLYYQVEDVNPDAQARDLHNFYDRKGTVSLVGGVNETVNYGRCQILFSRDQYFAIGSVRIPSQSNDEISESTTKVIKPKEVPEGLRFPTSDLSRITGSMIMSDE